MDKTEDYEYISKTIKDSLIPANIALELLYGEIFNYLESEKKKELSSDVIQTIPTNEVLNKYIATSREIQATLFNKISTYVLTIERISDHILCRRAAIERDQKKNKVIIETAEKVGVSPEESLFAKFEAATKNMTPEQKEQFLKQLRGE